jgi:restriction system protein
MTLPTFEDVMLPLLQYLSDNKERRYSETKEYLATVFQLSKEDLELEKPYGGNYFYNKIGWAKDYMTRAGLLEKKSGRFKITQRGIDVVNKHPDKINRQFLLQFPEFVPYVSPNKKANVEISKDELTNKSPDDLIDDGISQINNILKHDLLEKLKTVDDEFFEKLAIDLVEEMGYGKGKHTGRTGDKGIDGEISLDKLGLDKIFLQAKRYSGPVGATHVRDFIGALSLQKARKGIFITISDFPVNAYDDIKNSDKTIILINGDDLVEYMIELNIGIKTKKSFEIKEIDEDYFNE